MRIFGRSREEITGGCRKQHNGEHNNVYSSVNVIRSSDRGRYEKQLARMGVVTI
jgi:hypothetical protein